MRIVRFRNAQGRIVVAEDQGDNTARRLPDDWFRSAGPPPPVGPAEAIGERLPSIEPTSIFCIGLNYREHAVESGLEFPKYPVVFMKPSSSVTATDQPIIIPQCCDPAGEVDYECELAVVIGRSARNVPEDRALEYVWGYTAANDVSARKWQGSRGGGQWVRGKSFDTFCPLGPVLVTADEIPDPQTLALRTFVNGEKVQDHTTADMIFSVRQLIGFLSQDTTLLPGTVILTGTPPGVGFVRKPPLWLKHGDQVVVEIDKIGRLENTVHERMITTNGMPTTRWSA